MSNLPTIDQPKIKYVKKARQWVKTYFTFADSKAPKQVQEWSEAKPNA